MSIDKTRRRILSSIPHLLAIFASFKIGMLDVILNEIERERLLKELMSLEKKGVENERT